jgi:2,3-bisphosphoglycerate-dependent phosphoglycerate mutase
MSTLVLIRHGKSIWNLQSTNNPNQKKFKKKFTGWTDIPISEEGISEAKAAGKALKERGFVFDIAFTSLLKRAIQTLWLVLEELDLLWIPVKKSWQLNERHYGALQGMTTVDAVSKSGPEQVQQWRRGYDVRPPALSGDDPRNPRRDPRYQAIPEEELPLTESLKDTMERVLSYWHQSIAPEIKNGKKAIISAHGNSLRALVKHLDRVSDEDIVKLEIPTGIPMVYELDENLEPIKHDYLGDPEAVRKAIEELANQGRAR